MSQTHAGPDGRVWQGRGRAALGFDALAADVGAGPDAGACLLPDLAGQGLLQGLAGLDGAAAKRPVGGVPGDQDDLGLGREAAAKRLGRLGRRRQEGWVDPPDAVAGPIRDDGLLDKGLEGRGGSGVWGRVARRGGHGRQRRLVSGSTPRSLRSAPNFNLWFISPPAPFGNGNPTKWSGVSAGAIAATR